MALANDRILVTPGSGATVATHSPAGSNTTEYQVTILANASGHLADSQPTYYLSIPATTATANRYHWELFNGSTSNRTVAVKGIYPIVSTDTAVVGVVSVRYDFFRTTAQSTGGQNHSFESIGPSNSTLSCNFSRADPSDPTLVGSGISAFLVPTSITTGAWLFTAQVFTEETNAASVLQQYFNLIPQREWGKELEIPPGQGLTNRQGTVASVGSVAWLVAFTTDP